jgi:hypothetical protein
MRPVQKGVGKLRSLLEKFIELLSGFVGRIRRARKIVARFFHYAARFLVQAFFRDLQDAAEIALHGRFHGAVAMDAVEAPHAEGDKRRGGQNHSKLEGQKHPRTTRAGRAHH